MPRFTAGSPKASTPRICRRRSLCSPNSRRSRRHRRKVHDLPGLRRGDDRRQAVLHGVRYGVAGRLPGLRQLLSGGAKFCADCGAPIEAGTRTGPVRSEHTAAAIGPAPALTTAERRPLSVMFCDLIGSTALSSRLDAEDLREVIRTYQACVATTIRRFDGFIARYVGDGVLIYFGWPEARETDAERAVRAGLAVAAAVSATPVGGEPLHVRVGIATGLVVIGEPIGSGDSTPADGGR